MCQKFKLYRVAPMKVLLVAGLKSLGLQTDLGKCSTLWGVGAGLLEQDSWIHIPGSPLPAVWSWTSHLCLWAANSLSARRRAIRLKVLLWELNKAIYDNIEGCSIKASNYPFAKWSNKSFMIRKKCIFNFLMSTNTSARSTKSLNM